MRPADVGAGLVPALFDRRGRWGAHEGRPYASLRLRRTPQRTKCVCLVILASGFVDGLILLCCIIKYIILYVDITHWIC
jgi:hypothetical protein